MRRLTIPDRPDGTTLRRGIPVAAACLCAAAIVAGGALYVWFFAMLVALGVTATVTRGWAGLAALVIGVLAPFPSVPTLDRGVLLALISALVWTVCRWRARAREQQVQRTATERTAASARAVYDERLRIARDLHDMVSHGMSVMTIQAEYGALTADRDPTAPLKALQVVQETGHETLRQLRQMVDVLRSPADLDAATNGDQPCLSPAPGLEDVPDLLARTAAGGLRVDYETRGDLSRAPADVGLCVYRVVQEGVANVLQHGRADGALLLVHVREDDVRVRLANGSPGTSLLKDSPAGSGHGLVGIRERVSLLGGTTEAGATPEGGYALEVRIPISRVQAHGGARLR